MPARCVLEIGASYGYSTLWLAEAMRESGGDLVTLELQAHKSAYVREPLARAGLAGSMERLVGEASGDAQDLSPE